MSKDEDQRASQRRQGDRRKNEGSSGVPGGDERRQADRRKVDRRNAKD